MFGKFRMLIYIAVPLIFLSCSDWLGKESPTSKNGSINVVTHFQGGAQNPADGNVASNQRHERATVYSRLFLRILDDRDIIVRDTAINTSGHIVLSGFANIPADAEYRIVAWTQDGEGYIIHSPDTQTVFVSPNANANAVMTLLPRVGSIIAQFAAAPTNIGMFFMSFDSDSGLFQAEAPRMINTYIALNRVPYGATGTLSIKAQRTDGTFHIDWDTTNFTFRRENAYLTLSFLQRDVMQVSVNIRSPYNTVFTAFTDINTVLEEEKNLGIIISEFCVNAADNADFVEVANLSENPLTFNELTLEAIGTSRQTIVAQNVVIYPMSAFVFGNTTAANYWDNIDVTGRLALVSTSAILLLYGDGELLDYVIYFNYANVNSGWPNTSSSGRRSWELKELVPDPKHNNFGGNWRLSTEVGLIDGQNRVWFGTPGVLR